eukprot:UN07900
MRGRIKIKNRKTHQKRGSVIKKGDQNPFDGFCFVLTILLTNW